MLRLIARHSQNAWHADVVLHLRELCRGQLLRMELVGTAGLAFSTLIVWLNGEHLTGHCGVHLLHRRDGPFRSK